jgi:hypothetical protein
MIFQKVHVAVAKKILLEWHQVGLTFGLWLPTLWTFFDAMVGWCMNWCQIGCCSPL